MSKVTDPVPHRRGWTFGAWQRDLGEFTVSVFHSASGVGLWARGRTREDVIADAHRQIDEVYAARAQQQWTDPVVESVALRL